MAQMVKNLLETKETQIWSVGREDSLEKGMAIHSCLENPMDRGAWWATVHGVKKELDTTERLTLFPECANLFLFSVLFFQSNLCLSGIALLLIPCNSSHLLLSWPVIYLLRPISSITSLLWVLWRPTSSSPILPPAGTVLSNSSSFLYP